VRRLDPTGTYRMLAAMFVLICLVMVGLLSLMALLHAR
jgi:hypothetical protein